MENRICSQKWGIAPNGGVTNEPPWDSTMENQICSQKWGIAPNGDPTNEPPWGSTLKIETDVKNQMPTPLAGGLENDLEVGRLQSLEMIKGRLDFV